MRWRCTARVGAARAWCRSDAVAAANFRAGAALDVLHVVICAADGCSWYAETLAHSAIVEFLWRRVCAVRDASWTAPRRRQLSLGAGRAGRTIDPTRPRVFEYQVSQLAWSASDKHLPGQFVSCSCRIARLSASVEGQTGLLSTRETGDKRDDGQRRWQRRAKPSNDGLDGHCCTKPLENISRPLPAV